MGLIRTAGSPDEHPPTTVVAPDNLFKGVGRGQEENDTLYVIAAACEDVDAAIADYEAVKELNREVTSSHDFDAAVIDEHGKVKIVKKYEQPTRHGAAVGLRWGRAVGVTSLRFPPLGISLAAGTGDQVAANIKAANRVISRATDMAADQLASDMKQADADAAMTAGAAGGPLAGGGDDHDDDRGLTSG